MKKSILLFTFLIIAGCAISSVTHSQKVEIIENAFPLLEEYEVQGFFDMDWCKDIKYKRGSYAESACSRGYPTNAQNFDDISKEVFNEIKEALKNAKVVDIYNAKYENGKIAGGEFNVTSNNFFDRHRYYYQPGHKITTSTHAYCGGEMWVMPINNDWYFECEDWN